MLTSCLKRETENIFNKKLVAENIKITTDCAFNIVWNYHIQYERHLLDNVAVELYFELHRYVFYMNWDKTTQTICSSKITPQTCFKMTWERVWLSKALMLKCPPAPCQSLGRNCNTNSINTMEMWTSLVPLQLIVERKTNKPHGLQSQLSIFGALHFSIFD